MIRSKPKRRRGKARGPDKDRPLFYIYAPKSEYN